MRSPIFISWEPHPDSSTHCGRRRRIALTLPRALALRGAPLQYNSAFYAYSIGHIQRSIPALNGSDRCCDCRYDRWGNGFSPHSVLCAEAARLGHDDRNDHRVFFHRPTNLRAGLGACFRPLRTQAGSAHWTERLRGGVLCLRVCQCHLVTVPLPRRAGPRRRDDRCAAGVCERYGAFRRSCAFTGLAFGGNECRYDAGPGYRVLCHLLGTTVAGHSRSIAVRRECAICMAMASGIEATACAFGRPKTRMAWTIDGTPQSNRQCPAADFDLCGSHAGFLLPDVGSGALSER